MKLSKCTYGTLVQDTGGRIGMVVGIANNVNIADLCTRSQPENAITLVQWASGEKAGIDPANIEPYKD